MKQQRYEEALQDIMSIAKRYAEGFNVCYEPEIGYKLIINHIEDLKISECPEAPVPPPSVMGFKLFRRERGTNNLLSLGLANPNIVTYNQLSPTEFPSDTPATFFTSKENGLELLNTCIYAGSNREVFVMHRIKATGVVPEWNGKPKGFPFAKGTKFATSISIEKEIPLQVTYSVSK